MTEEDIIEELFTDTGGIDQDRAVKALKAFIVISRENNEIHFQEEGNKKLTVEEKILAFVLAKKLLKMRNYIESEEISAKEVKSAGLKSGSVDVGFKVLKEKGGFLMGSGSSYSLPNYKVAEALEKLELKIQKK